MKKSDVCNILKKNGEKHGQSFFLIDNCIKIKIDQFRCFELSKLDFSRRNEVHDLTPTQKKQL